LAARKQGETAANRHRCAVRRFIELHGDVPVRAISRPMVASYLKRVADLADHRKVPAALRGGLADPNAGLPRVSAPTVERHLASMKALLHYCLEEDWVVTNVATGLRAPKDERPKASRRRPFTREERAQLLARAIAECGEDGDLVWLIKLGAYTGCRLEELCQLARSNVRLVDGIWILEIDDLDGRHVKNEASVKQIPIHPAIRDAFVAWVERGRGERVFASFKMERGRYSNRMSGQVGRLMDRAGLCDPRLVFHSFRHTLKREMSNARIDPDVRRAILGHAPKDAHDEYAGPSLQAVAEEFARLPPLFGAVTPLTDAVQQGALTPRDA
jgi:integrase